MSTLDKLYQKNHLTFALIWIALYVVLTSVADGLSQDLGLTKALTLPVHVGLVVVLWSWVRHAQLEGAFGLCGTRVGAGRMLWYLPLAIIATHKLWHGVATNGSAVEGLLFVGSMLCVGLLEELIFRGLLFRAMEPNGRTSAIIVSSVTFGLGHIVNLFNASGQNLPETLAQITFAVSIGFVLTFVLLKCGSLWPPIIFHGINNALSFFEGPSAASPLAGHVLVIAVAVGYTLYLARLQDA